jgi:hypothetical protein
MQLMSMFKILYKPACSSHQGRVSSARFTSAWSIAPSQAAVLVKSDPLRHVGLTSVKFDLPSDRLCVKNLVAGALSWFY